MIEFDFELGGETYHVKDCSADFDGDRSGWSSEPACPMWCVTREGYWVIGFPRLPNDTPEMVVSRIRKLFLPNLAL
jgi:hypothetical protein